METLHHAVDLLVALAPIQHWRIDRYERHFARAEQVNLFRGVYESFTEAECSAPHTKPLGYDHPAPAAMYEERTRLIFPSDYPMLFWLQCLLATGQCSSLFDLGGHIGVGYYAYQRYLHYPQHLRWLVCDVPAVVARGREWAGTHDKLGQLSFTESLEDASGVDLFFASGSLQYLPQEFGEVLAGLAQPPQHLLINLLPLHLRESYFTLQNIGTAFCPFRISAEQRFVHQVTGLGYRLVDRWTNLEKACPIPFHPEHSLDRYHGFYFSRAS